MDRPKKVHLSLFYCPYDIPNSMDQLEKDLQNLFARAKTPLGPGFLMLLEFVTVRFQFGMSSSRAGWDLISRKPLLGGKELHHLPWSLGLADVGNSH